ncbi:hypothetical protein [Prosthecochloris sp.]|uniref:hypothetical protein n=1 Tax=Prosthecochloris sp. TaxID=290513 RepID=UPI0025F07F6A|nr:hypothetical protein [Prosthecochloris sp.]
METTEIINGCGHKISWDLTGEVLGRIREGLTEEVAEGYDEADDKFLATATVMHGEIIHIANPETGE